MLNLTHIKEGLRIYRKASKRKQKGFHEYKGNALSICKSIVEHCWNGTYLMTSNGHFCQFWSRDFGICAEALVDIGYRKRVLETLDYALSIFDRHDKITTTITPDGVPYDFPTYSVDSVPMIIHALKVARADDLIKKYQKLLLNEVRRSFKGTFDTKRSLVKTKQFSSMKDYSIRKSSTYDNCMIAMLREDLIGLDYFNPFKDHDIKGAIEQNLWSGKYFHDDLRKDGLVSGDANIFPFWTGVFQDKNMFDSCVKSMKKSRIDRPFPLKYTGENPKHGHVLPEIFVGGYERDSVWMHLGMCYMDVLLKHDKRQLKLFMGLYEKVIEKHHNFLEVFGRDGDPFCTPFYLCDESMLWASKFISVRKKMKEDD